MRLELALMHLGSKKLHNSLHEMDLSTYGYTHIDLLCQMKIVKHRGSLIIHKQALK